MNEECRASRIVALSLFLLAVSSPCRADLAADNADNDPYPVSGFLPGDNGGIGFVGWVELETGTPGSMYTTTAIDDGSYSWGLSGTYALGRGLSNSLSGGRWRFLALHDPDNTAFSGFSLRSSTNIGGGFSDYELIRFGLDPEEGGYDGSGVYVSTNAGASYDFLDCGWVDGEGDTLEYVIQWSGAGSYSLIVSNMNEGTISGFSGSMATGGVSMLGAAVYGTTLDESITFDDFQVIPEPAAILLMGLGTALLMLVSSRAKRIP